MQYKHDDFTFSFKRRKVIVNMKLYKASEKSNVSIKLAGWVKVGYMTQRASPLA